MKKKLIEVALPLEAINQESAREKSIRHGHPSTLRLWWARLCAIHQRLPIRIRTQGCPAAGGHVDGQQRTERDLDQ